jgi:hypothetical protein
MLTDEEYYLAMREYEQWLDEQAVVRTTDNQEEHEA